MTTVTAQALQKSRCMLQRLDALDYLTPVVASSVLARW